MLKFWNVLAEVVGLFSAIAFLIPTLLNNDTLRKVHVLKRKTAKAKGQLGTIVSDSPTLEAATRPKWTTFDQWMLFGGALLLLMSFVLKLYVAVRSST